MILDLLYLSNGPFVICEAGCVTRVLAVLCTRRLHPAGKEPLAASRPEDEVQGAPAGAELQQRGGGAQCGDRRAGSNGARIE